MPDISKITLPSGNTYDIKDTVARQAISGKVTFSVTWTQANYNSATPSQQGILKSPKNVTLYYNGGESSTTGALEASESTMGTFYLIYSNTRSTKDIYDEYVTVKTGNVLDPIYTWEKIGDTSADISGVVTDVTLNKQTDVVLGEDTTFALTNGAVAFATPSTASVLGEDSTFTLTPPTVNVTPAITYIGATATGTSVGANGTVFAITDLGIPSTQSFVKSVSADTSKKLVTTSVPNVTSNTSVTIPNVTDNVEVTIPNLTSTGTASTWSFAMGADADAETLIISGTNSTAPTVGTSLKASRVTLGNDLSASKVTLGSNITVATGDVDTSGSGSAVVTNITIGDSANAITALGIPQGASVLTGVKVTAQPTISLTSSGSASASRIQVATGISSVTVSGGSVTSNLDDLATVIDTMPTGTVNTAITVGTNDKVTALTNDTSLTVDKGE